MVDSAFHEEIRTITEDFDPTVFHNRGFLVTGGAGFLGSWICECLVALGGKVICLDNMATGLQENIVYLAAHPNFVFLDRDVTQKISGKFDYVLHLASRASPEEYQQHPIETLLANSEGTKNVLELARKSEATVLFTSTSEVYGDAQIIPTPETYNGNVSPNGIRSCYDEGKRFGEALCAAYRRQFDLNVRVARIFNSYGA